MCVQMFALPVSTSTKDVNREGLSASKNAVRTPGGKYAQAILGLAEHFLFPCLPIHSQWE